MLEVIAEPTAEMAQVRSLLTEQGRFPCRRTWERRLAAIPDRLPKQIALLGTCLVAQLQPWAHCGREVAIDSTTLVAHGGVRHKKDREAGVVPHTSIDPEAGWAKSGWHGWVYGWKLHLVSTVAHVWIPLAAELTPANTADNEAALPLLAELPDEVRFGLGDLHYNAPNVQEACAQAGRMLVATQYGPYPHSDEGVEVRRLFHKLRSVTIENFNEQFKGIFDAHGSVPTKGRQPTRRFALGAILVYQLALFQRAEAGLDLRVGLKPFLKAA